LASIAKCQAFHLKCESLGLTDPRDLRWAYEAVDEILPTDVHNAMFIPALEYQTSQAQKELWLPLAKSYRILGAYVQTELGHGSNVRALETTATFNAGDDSFVIDTPSVSATKWWPGGLGKTATHCILHARLILPKGGGGASVDMGVHAFFVQLRDLNTHNPLPGATLGDIGPKLGFNSIDNGFASFKNLKVPRFNLLAGVAVVHADGTYERVRGGEKRMYGSMLDVRANIVSGAAKALAKACTISVRYSIARKQGWKHGDPVAKHEQEVSVLEHPTQRRLLLPWVSWIFALHFTGQRFRSHYESFLNGDPAVPLAALHAESSGLKALITQRVNDGIEALRKLCGGHGYSHLSGLPELSANYLALATLEGTQQILEPQTARFLLRAHREAESTTSSQPTHAFSAAAPYLFHSTPPSSSASSSSSSPSAALCRHPADKHALLAALSLRAKLLADAAAADVQAHTQRLTNLLPHPHAASSAASPAKAAAAAAVEKAALSQCGTSLGKLCRAHSEFVLLKDFVSFVDANPPSLGSAEVAAFSNLCSLFGLHLVTSGDCQAELLRLRVLTPEAASACEAALNQQGDDGKGGLLAVVEKDALALVEAWDFTDAGLSHSAIGARDGDYAQRLLKYASTLEPLNKPGFDAHLPFIKELTGVHRNRSKL